MPRRLRSATGGYVYHVLNRAVGRATVFGKTRDYAAFEKVLRQAYDWLPMRLLAYCAMPNHWHLVVWPQQDGDLSEVHHDLAQELEATLKSWASIFTTLLTPAGWKEGNIKAGARRSTRNGKRFSGSSKINSRRRGGSEI